MTRQRTKGRNLHLAGRLVNELTTAGATTIEQANVYLRERYITTHNEVRHVISSA